MKTAEIKKRQIVRRRKRCIDDIVRWAAAHDGRPPRVEDWRHVSDQTFIKEHGAGWPSYLTVIRVSPDKTWDGMIAAAGFEPRGRGKPGLEAA